MAIEGKDPKDMLTRWLTQWGEEAGTRVMTREQLEFNIAYGFNADPDGLNLPFYKVILETANRNMMGLKGKRSDDVRDALISISDSENRDWGTRPAEEHMKKKQRRHDDNE